MTTTETTSGTRLIHASVKMVAKDTQKVLFKLGYDFEIINEIEDSFVEAALLHGFIGIISGEITSDEIDSTIANMLRCGELAYNSRMEAYLISVFEATEEIKQDMKEDGVLYYFDITDIEGLESTEATEANT